MFHKWSVNSFFIRLTFFLLGLQRLGTNPRKRKEITGNSIDNGTISFCVSRTGKVLFLLVLWVRGGMVFDAGYEFRDRSSIPREWQNTT